MELLIVAAGLIILDLLALRFGADSRNLDPYRKDSGLLNS